MSDENIFGGEAPNQDPTPPAAAPVTPENADPVKDPSVDLLSQIVGDDGAPKYKDVPTALNALQHSQNYIKELQQKLAEAEAKAKEAVTMEQVMEMLNKPPETPPVNPDPGEPGLTPDDVLRILQEQETAKTKKANAKAVAQKFRELHGDKAEEVFYGKAKEMGLTKESINQLASSSPQAVFSMFGIQESHKPAPAPSGVNTFGIPQNPAPTQRKPVMGYSSDRELAEYWANIKKEVEDSLSKQ